MNKTRWLAVGTGLLLISFSWSVYPRLRPALTSSTEFADEAATAFDTMQFEDTEPLSLLSEPAAIPTALTEQTAGQSVFDTCSMATYSRYLDAAVVQGEPNSSLLPLSTTDECLVLNASPEAFQSFVNHLGRWTTLRELQLAESAEQERVLSTAGNNPLLVLLSADDWQENLLQVSLLAARYPLVLLYFGAELPAPLQAWESTVLHFPDDQALSQALAVESLFGAVALRTAAGGFLPVTRLGHAPPELVGIDREKLSDIDRLVERGISRRAMPGCQVLVVKNQKIIYDRAFGSHTYEGERSVEKDDLYDLASITKAAATTLAVMKMTNEGELDLAARLKSYLPDYRRSATRNLRLRHLLAHHTGLQINMPIRKWLNDQTAFDTKKSENYPLAISNDFYMRADTRESFLNDLRRVRPGRSGYRYGDVNFLLLQQVVEHQSYQSMDAYLDDQFYRPLGLHRTGFLPGLRFAKEEIVPTEIDNQWRGGLVQGIVHDEASLLLGGVGGHAGLFSDAHGLAVLFQLLLNEGQYGGREYLQAETVQQFIKRNGYNYRAMGFDRLSGQSRSLHRYGASKETFGHTGFTGGCVWADPENDLIYIFLSNRVYPDDHNDRLQRMGIRERIHRVIYQSLGTYEFEA